VEGSLQMWLDDSEDAARYAGLAVLLGRLRREDERARFAAVYGAAAPDAEAGESLRGLLKAAATLQQREERVLAPRPMSAPAREVAQVA